jgi:hypothetical protein
MLSKLRYFDWTFSNTAEGATGILLVLAIVVTYFAT